MKSIGDYLMFRAIFSWKLGGQIKLPKTVKEFGNDLSSLEEDTQILLMKQMAQEFIRRS